MDEILELVLAAKNGDNHAFEALQIRISVRRANENVIRKRKIGDLATG